MCFGSNITPEMLAELLAEEDLELCDLMAAEDLEDVNLVVEVSHDVH